MASTDAKLMTFAEFQMVPNPPGGRYELHHGVLVNVAFPEYPHARAQWQLRRLFESAAGDSGIVKEELAYRPLPEHECWGADVAYLSRPRWDSIERWLEGAPELVAEILSPSNTASEIADKKKLCLENGSQQFWIVNTQLKQVEVSTPDGRSITYRSGQEIPLFFVAGRSIAVDAVFA